MCKQDTHTTPAAQTPAAQPLDREIQKANIELQLAQLRSNAEYYNSPAGQMQRQFETYQRLAKPLSESNFVPAAYKGNIGDCIVAVEMAARLGVFPLTVMQNLCIVKGNPTWKSKFLIGCVNTCGRYTTLDYHIGIDGKIGAVNYKTWEKGKDGKNREILKPFDQPGLDNLTCVAFCNEISTGRELTSPAVSLRMAVQEGWYNKDGSKWPTMPELMLRYRAASMWVSTYAPEMAMGFRTEEEQRDILDVDYEDMTEAQPAIVHKPRPTSPAMEDAKQKLRARSTGTREQNKTDNPANEMP